MRTFKCQSVTSGVTLVELIVTIVISSILALVLPSFIRQPVENYLDLAARAELTVLADQSLRRLARDVRSAVPNSLRVSGSGTVIELISTLEGARYRAAGGNNAAFGGANHNSANDRLTFTGGGDSQFNILGRLINPGINYGDSFPAGTRIVVYSTDTATLYSNAAGNSNPGVITPTTTIIQYSDDTDEDHIQLSTAHRFPFGSPGNRLSITDTAITYICDTSAGTITRYSGYNIQATQPTNPAVAPLNTANSDLLVTKVSSCDFTYQSGVTQRFALLIAELALERNDVMADASQPERVRLVHQIHVPNSP